MPIAIGIPGSSYNRNSINPLHFENDYRGRKRRIAHWRLLAIDYERGRRGVPNEQHYEDVLRSVLRKETRRVYKLLQTHYHTHEQPLHLIGHSRGGVLAYNLGAYHMSMVERGYTTRRMVRRIALINPGVVGGTVRRNGLPFYLSQLYFPHSHASSSDEGRGVSERHAAAVEYIKERLPDFDYRLPYRNESIPAMLESVSGRIPVDETFPTNHYRMFVGRQDRIVPHDVALEVGERTGIELVSYPEFGHDIPLADYKGKVLRDILRWFES